mgnify:CR=1 FL=1
MAEIAVVAKKLELMSVRAEAFASGRNLTNAWGNPMVEKVASSIVAEMAVAPRPVSVEEYNLAAIIQNINPAPSVAAYAKIR